jgi:hypothetical protein
MMIRTASRSIACLLIVGSAFLTSCSSEPATAENAEKELARVLQVWQSGLFYISPMARQKSSPEGGGDVSRFFEPRLDSNSLGSFEILSHESTEQEGEFKFKVRLNVKSSAMSVMNPVPPQFRDIEASYYVYQGNGPWVVESESMRAAKERLLGD